MCGFILLTLFRYSRIQSHLIVAWNIHRVGGFCLFVSWFVCFFFIGGRLHLINPVQEFSYAISPVCRLKELFFVCLFFRLFFFWGGFILSTLFSYSRIQSHLFVAWNIHTVVLHKTSVLEFLLFYCLSLSYFCSYNSCWKLKLIFLYSFNLFSRSLNCCSNAVLNADESTSAFFLDT